MDNIFKGLKRDIASFKSKYITPEVLREKAPEMKKAYNEALSAFLKSEQFRKFLSAEAKHTTHSLLAELLRSRTMHKHLKKIVVEEFKKGIDITWR